MKSSYSSAFEVKSSYSSGFEVGMIVARQAIVTSWATSGDAEKTHQPGGTLIGYRYRRPRSQMKIALAHKRLELRAGAERVLYLTAEGLRGRGPQVHLVRQAFRNPYPLGFYVNCVQGLTCPPTP